MRVVTPQEPADATTEAGTSWRELAVTRSLDPARNPTYAASHYRNRWYDNSGYQPVFWGTSDTYWTTNDYRWYDEGSDYDNDDDGGGFGDS